MRERRKEGTNERTNERMNEWTNERMNEWTNERMNEWMNEWMSERMKSRAWEDNSRAFYNTFYMWTVSSDVSIQRLHWQPLSVHLWAYCTHPTHDVMCEGWPQHRGLRPLRPLRQPNFRLRVS